MASDDLRTRIAAIYRAHRLTFFAGRGASVPKCDCGWRSPEEYTTCTDHPEHVADAVIRELKLHVVIVGDFQTVIKGSYPTPLEEPND